MPKTMDPILAILSVCGYWAIIITALYSQYGHFGDRSAWQTKDQYVRTPKRSLRLPSRKLESSKVVPVFVCPGLSWGFSDTLPKKKASG